MLKSYTLINLKSGGAINIRAVGNKEALQKYNLTKCKKEEALFILKREDFNYNTIQKIYCK